MHKRILFVDNERVFLVVFKNLFSRDRVTVDTAETMEEAIAMINDNDYDVIIADLRLTRAYGEEGLDILRYVKEHKPQTKVILMAGYRNPEIKEKAIGLGSDYYFEKPVHTFILRDALKNLGIPY
ncbi:MAG: response regulator [Nitrospira sp.]|nr:response regulator [Nitrospira sp.]